MAVMAPREVTPPMYGIETEYACSITLPNQKSLELIGECHSVDAKLGLYQEPEHSTAESISWADWSRALEAQDIYRNSKAMLSNGGRFYLDPSGPEYATPECSTAEEAVHRTFDGDEILLKTLSWLRDNEVISGFQLNRRIVDHNRSSRGVHLNTSIQRPSEDLSLKDVTISALAALNIAKGAMFGSGGLLLNRDGKTEFHHSPRLSLTTRLDASYALYWARPLVRDPPKPDGPAARLETVTSDALNFAWPLRASLVMTHALTRLIETGHLGKMLHAKEPVHAALSVGQYGSDATMVVETPKGTTENVTPLAVLRYVGELALAMNEDDQDVQLGSEATQVLAEVISITDKMSHDKHSVVTHVESVARYASMEQAMERKKADLDSEALCRFDYAWDLVGGGYAEKLRRDKQRGWEGFTESYSPSRAKHRMVTPPSDTRAHIRGEAIRRAQGNEGSDWDKLELLYHKEPAPPLYVLPDVSELPSPMSIPAARYTE